MGRPRDEDGQAMPFGLAIAGLGAGLALAMATMAGHVVDTGRARTAADAAALAGVVGDTPILSPGDSYTYTSGCPLPTPSGIMRGHYRMQLPSGKSFEADIPAFSLDAPVKKRVLN